MTQNVRSRALSEILQRYKGEKKKAKKAQSRKRPLSARPVSSSPLEKLYEERGIDLSELR